VTADVEARLQEGRAFEAEFCRRMDEYALAAGLDLPEPEPLEPPPPAEARTEIDLAAEGIGTVLWANGFRPDLGWIDLPLTDEHGWPVQTRGVTEHPGLFFVGTHWLHSRKSALLIGVGDDAAHVASVLTGER
jgi:putative flavoprotein involved in K+ transport